MLGVDLTVPGGGRAAALLGVVAAVCTSDAITNDGTRFYFDNALRDSVSHERKLAIWLSCWRSLQ